MIFRFNPTQPSRRKQNHRIRSFVESLESRCMLSISADDTIVSPHALINAAASSSSGIQGFTPAQIRKAYGITGDGSGQTIAIVDAFSDPNIAADLAVFDNQFGLAAPPAFSQVSSNGSPRKLPTADAGWDMEISLDVEWAHAIAPKANILLVDAASDSLANLMTAVNFARSISSVSVISMSWGTSEFRGQTSFDSDFTTPSGHTGITFVAASGDEGASGGAEWPAISSNVLSVGGTTLTLSSTGAIASETAWSGSSGGLSSYETLAAQSSSTGVQNRISPDVSFDADPNTGFAVYNSVPYQGYVGWQEVGGTSAGAPAWAGIIAITDAAGVAAKSTTLTTSQTLADVYALYSNSSSYSANFRDITSGLSLLSSGFRGPWGRSVYVSASTGYDILTGVGSPKVGSLIGALASNATPAIKSSAVTGVSSSSVSAARLRNAAIAARNDVAIPATVIEFEIGQSAQTALINELSLASSSSAPSAEAIAFQNRQTVAGGTFSDTMIPAVSLAKIDAGYSAIENLQYAQTNLRLMNVPAIALASSVSAMTPKARELLDESLSLVQNGVAALSSSFSQKDESGYLAILFAFAVADCVLLSYRYSGQGRKNAKSAFSTARPIEWLDSISPAN